MVTSKIRSLAMAWLVGFAGVERRTNISAGHLVGVSGINSVGSMMVILYAVFVRLVDVNNSGGSVIASVFVTALCGAVLDNVQRHPNACWSPYL